MFFESLEEAFAKEKELVTEEVLDSGKCKKDQEIPEGWKRGRSCRPRAT